MSSCFHPVALAAAILAATIGVGYADDTTVASNIERYPSS